MQSLSSAGSYYRTKSLLPESKANAFAACLAANPHFSGVSVEKSARAKSDNAFFVAFVPSNPERRQEMTDREQDKRAATAAAEGDGYTWCLDKDGGRPFFWCLSVSGEVYEVTPHSCSCLDHHYRCKPNGLKCKHQLALLNGQGQVTTW